MKKTLLSLTVFTFLFILICSCGQQKQQQQLQQKQIVGKQQLYDTLNSGVKVSLNAVEFLTTPHGIVVGDSGTILITTNGGYNWKNVGGLTSANLYGVSIVDTDIVVAVGEHETILRSTTRGETWYSVDTHGDPPFQKTLRDVAFDTNYTGYAVGDKGIIFRSTNGGANWIKVHENPSLTLNGISFNKSNKPCVVGNKVLISESGKWKEIMSPKENLNSVHFTQVRFHVYSDDGFAVGDKGTILRTKDGGNNWLRDTSVTLENLRGVFISAPHWGHAVGDNGTVVRYNGKNWTLLPKATNKRLNAVDPPSHSWSGFCVDEDGNDYWINPPGVDFSFFDSLSIKGIPTCTWEFALKTPGNLTTEYPQGSGNLVTYQFFEVCSSLQQSFFGGGGPTGGWAHQDRFYSRSDTLKTNQTYSHASGPNKLEQIVLTPPANGRITSYYIGDDGNPYTLMSWDIGCP